MLDWTSIQIIPKYHPKSSPSHGFVAQIADLTMGTDGTSLCAYAQWGWKLCCVSKLAGS